MQGAGHGVVIFDADGIEFMVMAAGTAQSHAQEGLANLDHLRVDVVGAHALLVGVDDFHIAHHQKAGGGEVLCALLGLLEGHEITGDLLAHKAVKGFVLVEGGDEVVAVAPGLLGVHAVGGAHHVGVAGEIQPVAGPAFAVGLGAKQAINHAFIGLRAAVSQIGEQLIFAGGPASEVKAAAPQPGFAIGLGPRLNAGLFLGGQKEMVQRIPRPLPMLHCRRGGIVHWPEGPEAAPCLEVNACLGQAGLRLARVWGALLHPLLEHRDLFGRQPSAGRHFKVGVMVAHRLDQQALLGLARNHGRAVVAAGLPA